MNKNGKQRFAALRTIAMIFANLTAILSANYIVFYILDHYNPGFHFVVRSEFFLTKYLHFVIPILMLLTALLYLLLFVGGGVKAKKLNKKRLIIILIADVLLAGAFAMTVNARAFGWIKWLRPVEAAPVAIATMPPKTTQAPTDVPSEAPVDTSIAVPETPANTQGTPGVNLPTLEPTEVPTPEPTYEPTPEPTEAPESPAEECTEGPLGAPTADDKPAVPWPVFAAVGGAVLLAAALLLLRRRH